MGHGSQASFYGPLEPGHVEWAKGTKPGWLETVTPAGAGERGTKGRDGHTSSSDQLYLGSGGGCLAQQVTIWTERKTWDIHHKEQKDKEEKDDSNSTEDKSSFTVLLMGGQQLTSMDMNGFGPSIHKWGNITQGVTTDDSIIHEYCDRSRLSLYALCLCPQRCCSLSNTSLVTEAKVAMQIIYSIQWYDAKHLSSLHQTITRTYTKGLHCMSAQGVENLNLPSNSAKVL